MSDTLQRWQAQVAACRREREEPDAQAWQHMARWYQNWVRHNDYAALVLPRLRQCLNARSRVLEIGPGTGAFTLPLAQTAQEIVSVEPSADMRAVLGENLGQAGITHVRVVPQPIEESITTLDGPFDLAFAAYSLYNVSEIDVVARELVRLARHVVLLMGTGEQRDWYRDLYRRFRGRELVSPPQVQYFYPLLLDMGIYADVHVFWTSYNDVYDSEDALVAWWMHKLRLPDARRAELRAALLPLTEQRGTHIGIYDRARAALVWIERERHVTRIESEVI